MAKCQNVGVEPVEKTWAIISRIFKPRGRNIYHFPVLVCYPLLGIYNNVWRGLDPHTPDVANEASRRIVPHL